MNDTSGPHGNRSSASAALQSLLASKLRRRTDFDGSILYRTIWKKRTTRSGRRICALRARAWPSGKPKSGTGPRGGWRGPFRIVLIPSSRPSYAIIGTGLSDDALQALLTFDSDCILSGWPTTKARDGTAGPDMERRDSGNPNSDVVTVAQLAGWGTVTAKQAKYSYDHGNRDKPVLRLPGEAEMAGWSTASARDWKDTPGMSTERPDGRHRVDQLPRMALMAGWPTSMAGTPAQKGYNEAGNTDSSRKTVALMAEMELPIRLTASGAILTGCSAGMESGGPLRPEHSRWVMGIPGAWDDCAGTGTR